MTQPSIFALIRMAMAQAQFEDTETRVVIMHGIDAIEKADNDNSGISIEDSKYVEDACETIQEHLIELLDSGEDELENSAESNDEELNDEDIEDEIERD